MTVNASENATKSCHYVTFSDLFSDAAGGHLVVYCHTCDIHIERVDDLAFEEEWDATFISMVMDHHGFTNREREAVWFTAALGDMTAALALSAELQRVRCPRYPAVCTHR